MNTKLTLRLKKNLIEEAKAEAAKRGKSVSQMVADFFESLATAPRETGIETPPLTRSLTGVLKNSTLTEDDFKKHLKEKHL